MRAIFPCNLPWRPDARSAAPPTQPGRNTCAQNSFNRTGIAPSHRRKNHPRFRAPDDPLRGADRRGWRTVIELRFETEERKLQPGDIDHVHLVAGCDRRRRVSRGQRMPVVPSVRFRMALHDRDHFFMAWRSGNRGGKNHDSPNAPTVPRAPCGFAHAFRRLSAACLANRHLERHATSAGRKRTVTGTGAGSMMRFKSNSLACRPTA